MKSYLLKKIDSSYPKVMLEDDYLGYVFSPRLKNVPVKKVSVYDKELIENILTNKFNRNFRKILNYFLKIINLDETEDSAEATALVLDEIAKMKSMIAQKYQQFLSNEKEQEFFNQIHQLEIEVQREIMEINMNNLYNRMNYYENMEQQKGFSR